MKALLIMVAILAGGCVTNPKTGVREPFIPFQAKFCGEHNGVQVCTGYKSTDGFFVEGRLKKTGSK
jgi:hypothetical protein